ncbi:MAG: TonB-dependent receptor [Bacteroidota bacterium]
MKRLTMLFAFFVFAGSFLYAQGVLITGTITSADDGTPLPGVSVVVQGTTIGTVTDFEGNYSITVPESSNTLIYSFVGMRTAEVAIDGQTVMDVVLETDAVGIDEVMVVAYGTAKKASFTGSAENIDTDKIENIQATSVSKMLEGATAGVQVSTASGQPGSNAAIRIRGIGSINASSNPLYVVDGVPYGGNLNSINPDDIETITVLKDATAAALYGARGANGVIVISTSKGKAGKMELEVKVRHGWSDRAINEYPRLNQAQHYEKTWEAYRNSLVYGADYSMEEAGQIASYGQDADGNSINTVAQLGNYNAYDVNPTQLIGTDGKINPSANLLYPNDWEDVLFRVANKQDYNVSVNGGDDKSNYYISLGYLDEEGLMEYSSMQRFSGRVNAESQVKKWLKIGLSTNAVTYNTNNFSAGNSTTSNPFFFSRVMGPIFPVYAHNTWNQPGAGDIMLDSDGNKLYDFGSAEMTFDDGYGNAVPGLRPYAGTFNLAGSLHLDERSTQVDAVSARTYADFSILPGLNFRTNLSVDFNGSSGTTYQNSSFGDAAGYGRITKNYGRRMVTTFNQLLTYNKSFGQSTVDVLAGHESYLYRYNLLTATRIGFPFEGIRELAPAATGEGSNSYENNDRIESFLGRVNYDFADRYYLSASIRTDGSSRFHPDTRWGTFWSVGGSWRISEESFLQAEWINTLKLKASYGVQGNNDGIGFYPYQGLYGLGNDNASFSGALATSLELQELMWEENGNFNTGVEFAIFNRVRGSFEYFVRASNNLLFEVPQPRSLGIDTKWENIGGMENRGVEAIISADIIAAEGFRWNIDANITHYKNEITDLPQEEIIVGSKKYMAGKSVFEFFTWEYAGADAETGAALYWKDEVEQDGEGNDVIGDDGKPVKTGNRLLTDDPTDADRYYLGTSIPTVYGGVTNTFEFMGFDLSIFLTYSIGGKFLDRNYMWLMREGDLGFAWHTDILEGWTEALDANGLPTGATIDENGDKVQIPYDPDMIPRVEVGNTDLRYTSSRFLFDATYFNVRNITLGYNLPKNVASRIGAGGLRVFVTADNLYIWSKNPGMDPRQNFGGDASTQYSPIKTYTVGLNVKF